MLRVWGHELCSCLLKKKWEFCFFFFIPLHFLFLLCCQVLYIGRPIIYVINFIAAGIFCILFILVNFA